MGTTKHARTLALLVTALLALAMPLATANHPQGPTGQVLLSFDHKEGNDWWVEVEILGPSADDVVRVQATTDNENWHELTLRDWGNWAGSFRLHDQVRFRVLTDVSDFWFVSCAFEHPSGQEQCNEFSPSVERGAHEDAMFIHKGGNEWWVEILVKGSHVPDQRPDKVVARAESSDRWHELELRSWGHWAGSFHIPPGELVRFEAFRGASKGGALSWELSCWFSHPGGDERCMGGTPPGLLAMFEDVRGNEWWVEVDVDSAKAITRVDARVNDDGPWRALEKRDWGSWAASFHVPEGAIVQFRAHSSDGSWDMSNAAWRWTDQAQVPPPGAPDADFRNIQGNEWWVQTNVVANREIVAVRINVRENPDDPYATYQLDHREWGDWVLSQNVPADHEVRFRAYLLGVDRPIESHWMTWPPQ